MRGSRSAIPVSLRFRCRSSRRFWYRCCARHPPKRADSWNSNGSCTSVSTSHSDPPLILPGDLRRRRRRSRTRPLRLALIATAVIAIATAGVFGVRWFRALPTPGSEAYEKVTQAFYKGLASLEVGLLDDAKREFTI